MPGVAAGGNADVAAGGNADVSDVAAGGNPDVSDVAPGGNADVSDVAAGGNADVSATGAKYLGKQENEFTMPPEMLMDSGNSGRVVDAYRGVAELPGLITNTAGGTHPGILPSFSIFSKNRGHGSLAGSGASMSGAAAGGTNTRSMSEYNFATSSYGPNLAQAGLNSDTQSGSNSDTTASEHFGVLPGYTATSSYDPNWNSQQAVEAQPGSNSGTTASAHFGRPHDYSATPSYDPNSAQAVAAQSGSTLEETPTLPDNDNQSGRLMQR